MWLHLLIGTLGLHVGASRGVSLSDAEQIAGAIAAAIERRSQEPAVVDRSDWEQCAEVSPCVDKVRARLRAERVVLLSVVGGPLQVFVQATLVASDGATKEASAKVPRDASSDPMAWASLAAALVDAPVAILVPTATVAPSRGTAAYGWIAMGIGGAALAGGAALGLASRSTRSTIESTALTAERRSMLDDRASSQATFANVLLGTAITGLATGAVLWLID